MGQRQGWRVKLHAPVARESLLGVLGTLGGDEAIRAEAVKRFEANDLDGNSRDRSCASWPTRTARATTRSSSSATARPPHPRRAALPVWGLGEFNEERVALDAARSASASSVRKMARSVARDLVAQRHGRSASVDVLHRPLGRRREEVPEQLARSLIARRAQRSSGTSPSPTRSRRFTPRIPSAETSEPSCKRSNACVWVSPSRRRCANSFNAAP